MKKLTIKKMGIHSVAKVVGVLYALIGLIPGAFITLFTLLPVGADSQTAGFIFGIGALVMFPILYGAMGYIFGALFAWLFNQITPRVGGIHIEVEEVVNTDTQN